MRPQRLNLDDFPDSPYAGELRHRRRRLRFPAPLEDEYLDEHLRRVRNRARIWTALAVVLAVGFSIAQWREAGGWAPAVAAHFLVILPASVGMAWLAWSPGRMRAYLRVATVLAPVLGIAIAAAVADAVGTGRPEELASLTLVTIATFFFMGLLFRGALVAGTAILVTFAVSGALAGVAPALLAKCGLFLGIATLLGATIGWDVENSYRRRFLEQSLMAEMVDRDGLTGLKNRRAFDEHLLRVWQQSLRSNSELAVMMVDIDSFKRYNDRYGHQAGDEALRKVANVVREFARRPFDIAARYGGEEFSVTIYDIDAEAIEDIAERLRRAVEALEIEHPESGCSRFVTISVGVGVVRPKIDRTPQGLVQLADEALYQAKESGRNRCVINGREAYESLVTGKYRHPHLTRAGDE